MKIGSMFEKGDPNPMQCTDEQFESWLERDPIASAIAKRAVMTYIAHTTKDAEPRMMLMIGVEGDKFCPHPENANCSGHGCVPMPLDWTPARWGALPV